MGLGFNDASRGSVASSPTVRLDAARASSRTSVNPESSVFIQSPDSSLSVKTAPISGSVSLSSTTIIMPVMPASMCSNTWQWYIQPSVPPCSFPLSLASMTNVWRCNGTISFTSMMSAAPPVASTQRWP